jgi:hypothetical protein
MEEFSAILKWQGEKIVSEDSKCIRSTSKGSRVDLQYPLWGVNGFFWNDPLGILCTVLYNCAMLPIYPVFC